MCSKGVGKGGDLNTSSLLEAEREEAVSANVSRLVCGKFEQGDDESTVRNSTLPT